MVAITVLLPRTLAADAGDSREHQFELGPQPTVAGLLDGLTERFPRLGRRLRDETGAVRRYVNIYLDGEDIRQLAGTATALEAGQQVRVIQSVAGGR